MPAAARLPIAFDSRKNLWLWDGNYAVPAKFEYDAYLWNPDTQTLFLTDYFTQVQAN